MFEGDGLQPDWRLRQLAQTSANFGFLLDDEPLLLSYGAAAEAYVFDDPNAGMVKARQFGEAPADALLVRLGIPGSRATQAEKVAELTRNADRRPRSTDLDRSPGGRHGRGSRGFAGLSSG